MYVLVANPAPCISQARVLLDLRQAAVQRNWAAVSAALGPGPGPSPGPALRGDLSRIWRVVKHETDFIASARDFHLLDRQLSVFVSSFDPAPPVRTMSMSFQHLEMDLQRAKEISAALQACDKAIGDQYFSQEHVLSFQLLLRYSRFMACCPTRARSGFMYLFHVCMRVAAEP